MNNGWDRRNEKKYQQGLRPAVQSCYHSKVDGQEVVVTVYEPQVDVVPGLWNTPGDVVHEIVAISKFNTDSWKFAESDQVSQFDEGGNESEFLG